jgi:hypothetical protein
MARSLSFTTLQVTCHMHHSFMHVITCHEHGDAYNNIYTMCVMPWHELQFNLELGSHGFALHKTCLFFPILLHVFLF